MVSFVNWAPPVAGTERERHIDRRTTYHARNLHSQLHQLIRNVRKGGGGGILHASSARDIYRAPESHRLTTALIFKYIPKMTTKKNAPLGIVVDNHSP